MPSGAKKRKALKKKKQQEAIGTSTNNNKGFNGTFFVARFWFQDSLFAMSIDLSSMVLKDFSIVSAS